jgi:osmoprotectant transport system permease protein
MILADVGGEPPVRWNWISDHFGHLMSMSGHHLYLSLMPVLYGLIISIPLGVVSRRWRWLYPPVLTASNILYAIPALALFVLIIPYTGLFSDYTLIIPLTLYTLSVLVPNVVDGLRAVPDAVRQAATAMGFGPLRRLVQVELPIAVPIVIAGVRIATVSSISLVSVGQLIGNGALGQLFTDGAQRAFPTELFAGIVLTLVLALLADGILVTCQRLLTPWARRTARS